MMAPELWMNGRQITGRRSDRAPVLAPVVLTWGASTGLEQPTPANLKFTVLFRDGMHDIPDLTNGAKIELIQPGVRRRTIFAGSIRTMGAEPSARVKGALEVTADATDYMADFEGEFISTAWEGGLARREQLLEALSEAGWDAIIPDDPRPSAQATYNSIKLSTMLDRHISRYRGRRYDTSRRNFGTLIKQISVMEGTARFTPADTLIATPSKSWSRTYNTPSIGGIPSPILKLLASNVLLNPEWSQDPNNTITAVNFSTMIQGDDGYTSQAEHHYKAPREIISTYGLRSIEVESDLQTPSDWPTAAKDWMNDDSPWQMADLTIRNTDELTDETLAELLDQETRYKTLVTVSGILGNRPDPGPSVMRSYLLGGEYEWTGQRWDMRLSLERTIYAQTAKKATFASIKNSTNPRISTATLSSISRHLTVADFREIEEPR